MSSTYIPPHLRNKPSHNGQAPVLGTFSKNSGQEGPSDYRARPSNYIEKRGDILYADTDSALMKYGGAPRSYVPPHARYQAPSYSQSSYSNKSPAPEGDRRISNGKHSITLSAEKAKEWMNLDSGDIEVHDVDSKSLDRFYELVEKNVPTSLDNVASLVNQLEPRSFAWASHVILDRETVKNYSRSQLLRAIGDALRQNSKLAGNFYRKPVPYLVYGNFFLWKDSNLLNAHSYTKKELIQKTPAISVMTAVLQQTWLVGGMGDVESEFPLTAVNWSDLTHYGAHLDFFHSVEETHSDVLFLAYTERKVEEEQEDVQVYTGKKHRESVKRVNNIVRDFVNEAQLALISYDDSLPARLRPQAQTTYHELIGYDVGEKKDRMVASNKVELAVAEPVKASWDDEKSDAEVTSHASRLVSSLPGDERDAMFLFDALVRYYSRTENLTKVEKIKRMGIRVLIHPSEIVTPENDFTWAIMREVLYGGHLSRDYKQLTLAISDYIQVASNLSRHLSKKTFDHFRIFLDQAKVNPELLSAMSGHVIRPGARVDMQGRPIPDKIPVKLLEYENVLPELFLPTPDDIRAHNKAVLTWNKLHKHDIEARRIKEAERRAKVEEEAAAKEEAKKKQKESVANAIAEKKKEAEKKREAAEKKKREELKKRQKEYQDRLEKAGLPDQDDEERGLPE